MMKKLVKSKMYLVGTLTMSIILFVSTGIQFWLTDYFINVLHFERERVNIAYAIVSITGPTSGCGYGTFFLTKGVSSSIGEAVTRTPLLSMSCLFSRLWASDRPSSSPSSITSTSWPFFSGSSSSSEEP